MFVSVKDSTKFELSRVLGRYYLEMEQNVAILPNRIDVRKLATAASYE